jgi:hypothetical protein
LEDSGKDERRFERTHGKTRQMMSLHACMGQALKPILILAPITCALQRKQRQMVLLLLVLLIGSQPATLSKGFDTAKT